MPALPKFLTLIFFSLTCYMLGSCGQQLGYFLSPDDRVTSWHILPESYLEFLQPHYNFDLRKVRYAENVPLVTSFDALTIKYKIYFKDKLSFGLLSHELEHVSQQEKNPFFLESYFASSALSALEGAGSGGFSVDGAHGNIQYEKRAKDKARLIKQLWDQRIVKTLQNLSSKSPASR